MFREKEDASLVRRAIMASVDEALAEAAHSLQDAEVEDYIELVEMQLRGLAVVHWRPPGPSAPVCPSCGRTGSWFQSVETGEVKCGCELIAQS